MKKISVVYPTKGRPKIAIETYHKWLSRADNMRTSDFLLSIDDSDNYDYLDFSCKVLNMPNKNAVEAINSAAKYVKNDVIVVISDDFDCPQHWDTLLIEAIGNRKDFCAKTNDCLQPTLITLPIMDRVYYERYGYIYNPDYAHMFVDQEMTAVALMTGKYIKLDLTFEHLHYSTGKSKKDAINDRNNATWQQGERLFNERLKNNFGIEKPVMEYKDIVWR